MKKLVAILLVFAMVCGMVPAVAAADTAGTEVTASNEALTATATVSENEITLTVTTDTDTNSGCVTVSYPGTLTLSSAESAAADTGVTQINTTEAGRVTAGWADTAVCPAGTAVLTLVFTGAEEAEFGISATGLYLGTTAIAAEDFTLPVEAGEPEHVHNYVQTEVVEATCTEDGYIVYTCTECGDTYTEVLPAIPCPSAAFTDVDTSRWYHQGIDFVVAHGLMIGMTDTSFGPNVTLSRGMVVTILYRAAGEPEAEFAGTFSDVAADRYYSAAVEWAAANGIVSGYPNGTFLPNNGIIRQDIAVILYNYAKLIGADGYEPVDLTVYPDADSINDYAKTAMNWAVSCGLILGDKDVSTGIVSLNPKATATRAQFATILARFLTREVEAPEPPAPPAYTVTFQAEHAAAFVDGTAVTAVSVTEGESLSFTVSVEDGFELVSVTAGETALLANADGVYTLSNVSQDVTVTVTTRKPPVLFTVSFETEYAAALVNGEAVTAVTAEDGSDIKFQVKVDEGCQLVGVTAGGETLEADSEGYYTLTVTADVTVEIQAEKIPAVYYVTLEGDGTAYCLYEGAVVESIPVTEGTKYIAFSVLGDTSHMVTGMTASSGVLTKAGNRYVLSGIHADITLSYTTDLRQYQVSFSYTYNATYPIEPQTVSWGGYAYDPGINGTTNQRTGYHLSGWYTDDTYAQEFDFSTPIYADTVLYSFWTINTYTVTFNSNGGSEVPAQYVSYGKYAVQPANPTKEGYTFAGWFTDEELTQRFIFSSTSIKQDYVLYAKWTDGVLVDVYLDGKTGDDSNTGTNTADAVKTFDRALELLEFSQNKVIRICGTVTVSGTQTWDLSAYPDAIVTRDDGYKSSYLFSVSGSGNSLTLQNITIDGGVGGYMIGFAGAGTTLNLNAGAVIQNNTTSGTSGCLYISGAGATLNMNGGKVTGCSTTSTSGVGAIYVNGAGATLNLNDGEISNCTGARAGAIYNYGSSSGKAVVTINGGKITGCTGTSTSASYYSTGAYNGSTYSQLIMNGGEISDCTGTLCADAITLSNTTSAVAEINKGVIKSSGSKPAIYSISTTANNFVINAQNAGDLIIEGEIFLRNTTTANSTITVAAPLTNINSDLQVTLNAAIINAQIAAGNATYLMTEADMEKIHLTNDLEDMFKITLKANTVLLEKTVTPDFCVYLAGTIATTTAPTVGDDSNDGLTEATPVATFARAKEILKANAVPGGNNQIVILNTVYISSDEVWDLSGIDGASVVRGDSFKTYLINVGDTTTSTPISTTANTPGNLTLRNITIDGNKFYNVVTNGAMIRVQYGTLTIEDGTVLQNNGNALAGPSTGGAIYSNTYGKVVMNGGLITGNRTTTSGGAVYLTGLPNTADGPTGYATFTMNGGTITGNTAPKGGGIQDNYGYQVYLNGGTISGNTATTTAGSDDICVGSATASVNSGKWYVSPSFGLGKVMLAKTGYYLTITETIANMETPWQLAYGTFTDGATVLAGSDYTLTQGDLDKLTLTTDGYRLELDTENNQIVIRAAAE